MDQADVEAVAKSLHDLVGLAGAEQAGVDEDARELVANRLVDECRGDRGIHAAREAADDAARTDLRADGGHGAGTERVHRPEPGQARDAMGEIAQERRAVRRMHDLGMEHRAVEFSPVVRQHREGGAFAAGDGLKTGRQAGHAVAVRHPDFFARARGPQARGQRALAGDVDVLGAELAVVRGFDRAAERRAHRLLPVADAQHGQAEREPGGVGLGAAAFGDARGTARQDQRAGAGPVDLGGCQRVRDDLAIDAGFAQPAGDQLRDLAAEVDDQDEFGGRAAQEETWAAAIRVAIGDQA